MNASKKCPWKPICKLISQSKLWLKSCINLHTTNSHNKNTLKKTQYTCITSVTNINHMIYKLTNVKIKDMSSMTNTGDRKCFLFDISLFFFSFLRSFLIDIWNFEGIMNSIFHQIHKSVIHNRNNGDKNCAKIPSDNYRCKTKYETLLQNWCLFVSGIVHDLFQQLFVRRMRYLIFRGSLIRSWTQIERGKNPPQDDNNWSIPNERILLLMFKSCEYKKTSTIYNWKAN